MPGMLHFLMGKLWFSGCSVMAVCGELWTVLPAESVCSQMEAVLKKMECSYNGMEITVGLSLSTEAQMTVKVMELNNNKFNNLIT